MREFLLLCEAEELAQAPGVLVLQLLLSTCYGLVLITTSCTTISINTSCSMLNTAFNIECCMAHRTLSLQLSYIWLACWQFG